MIVGATVCMYGLSHSTLEQKSGRNTETFVFGFVPDDGIPINLETHIIVPHWSNAAIFNGRTLMVTYLNDKSRTLSNEAVDIKILSGENAGWHDSLDPRPFGIWLAIPIGAMIAGIGYIGLRFRKDDLKALESSEHGRSIRDA